MFIILTISSPVHSQTTSQQLVYQPKIVEPVAQSWMWRRALPLRKKGFRSLANGPNGNTWLATEQGLYDFDGYTYKQILLLPEAENKSINHIFNASNHRIFVASEDALYLFSKNQWQKITDARFKTAVHKSFAEDLNGNIWAISEAGIIKITDHNAEIQIKTGESILGIAIDRQSNIWITLRNQQSVFRCPTNLRINEVQTQCTAFIPDAREGAFTRQYRPFVDSNNHLWLTNAQADGGIFHYQIDKQTWNQYQLDYSFTSAVETYDGKLFFATNKDIHEFTNGKWTVIPISSDQPILNDLQLTETQNKRLWIASINGFIYNIDRSYNMFKEYSELLFQTEAQNGAHWFIENKGKLVSYLPEKDAWFIHSENENIMDTPLALIETKNRDIVVAGSHKKQAALSILRDDKWHLHIIDNFTPTPAYRTLKEASDGYIYLGSQSVLRGKHNYLGGFIRFQLREEGTIILDHFTPPRAPRVVRDIAEIQDNRLWLSSNQIHIFDTKNSTITLQQPKEFTLEELPILASDGKDTTWVVSFGRAVYKHSKDGWEKVIPDETLGNNLVSFLLPHTNNQLYLTTLNGITFFDGETWNRKYLPEQLALMRDSGSLKLDSDENLWLNYASQDWFSRAEASSRTNIDNEKVRSIRYTRDQDPPIIEILEYQQEVISGGRQFIRWDAYDKWALTLRTRFKFSFRINNGEWSPYDFRRNSNYWNLPDGTHTFEVRAKDVSGNVSTQHASVSFTVLPPIWKQLWFISLISGFVIAIILLVLFIIKQREKHLIHINQLKMDHYTNITHEFRTPLTIILGPLEKLRKELANPEHAKLAQIAYRSSQRLMQLVDQVLDIRKIEQGHDKLQPSADNPVVFIRELLAYYLPLAGEKSIVIRQDLEASEKTYLFDRDKLQKILDNLLLNSIKYTPNGGSITVRAALELKSESDSILNIEIEDTGIGIPKEKQSKIFSSYYRVDNTVSKGHGIGLSYVKKLVELHQGKISVTSPCDIKTKTGTCISLQLVLENSFSSSNKESNENNIIEKPHLISVDGESDSRDLLLLIEDNHDIRDFIKIELKDQYRIIEAENGKVGFEMARQEVPDIIVSDVMMPEMDGYECCRLLKAYEITSHIPIILLTARRSREHELEGLKTGADDYLSKPVDIELLKLRIHNQLEHARVLRERYVSQIDEQDIAFHIAIENPIDKRFLERMNNFLEENIADTTLDTSEMATKLGYSRSTLYRKIKAVTGKSPTQLIRTQRLNKASLLLKTGKVTITDVIAEVGFSDMSYFSRCFKEQFGVSPSAYIANLENEIK